MEKLNFSETLATTQFLQLIMDTIPQFIFWKDLDCVYLGCNQNFAKSAGLANPEEIIGLTDYDLPWSKEEAAFFRETDKKVMESNTPKINFEEPQTINTGEIRWLRTSKIPLKNKQGDIIGILGTYEDITAWKKLELELKQSNLALKTSILELEEINLDIRQFTYAAHHDYQTPLQNINNFVKIFQKDYQERLDEKGQQYLIYINDSILKLNLLSKNMIDFLGIKWTSSKKELVDISQLLKEVLLEHQSLIEEQQVSISYQLSTIQLICYREQIKFVFKELIKNGIQFNQKNPSLKIICKSQDNNWLFSISDNGLGIHKQFREYIYQPFKRLHTWKEYQGTGMGLTLCNKIIGLHKGKLWHEPNNKEGTTFYFYLPKE